MHLLDYSIFLIALYRTEKSINDKGKEIISKYIVTNPSPDLEITATDVGLALAIKAPDDEYFKWSFQYNNTEKLSEKASVKEPEVTKHKQLIGDKTEESVLTEVKNRIASLIDKAESLLNTAESLKNKVKLPIVEANNDK